MCTLSIPIAAFLLAVLIACTTSFQAVFGSFERYNTKLTLYVISMSGLSLVIALNDDCDILAQSVKFE